MRIFDRKCEICGKMFAGALGLSKHIKQSHPEIGTETYFCSYLGEKGVCVCGKNCRFVGLGQGYNRFCSSSCGMKESRANMKLDQEKYDAFVAKVKENQAAIWENRSEEERTAIHHKVGATMKERNAMMTQEERNEKFGWLSKLEGEERALAIEKVTASLKRFYETATFEQLKEVQRKRDNTYNERYGVPLPEFTEAEMKRTRDSLNKFFGLSDE